MNQETPSKENYSPYRFQKFSCIAAMAGLVGVLALFVTFFPRAQRSTSFTNSLSPILQKRIDQNRSPLPDYADIFEDPAPRYTSNYYRGFSYEKSPINQEDDKQKDNEELKRREAIRRLLLR